MRIALPVWLCLAVALLGGCAASGVSRGGSGEGPGGKADDDETGVVCNEDPDTTDGEEQADPRGRCTAPDPLLTSDEIAQVQRYLDNLCGDTWCEGDFDWWTTDMSCDWVGGCVISFRTRHYTSDSGFPEDVLEGRTPEELTKAKPDYQLTATITDSDRDEEGVWLYATCDLRDHYYTREDILEEGGYELRASDTLYDQLSECVFAIEDMMFELPYVTYPQPCDADLLDGLDNCVWNMRFEMSDAAAIADCTSEESLRGQYAEECSEPADAPDICDRSVENILSAMWDSCRSVVTERYPGR